MSPVVTGPAHGSPGDIARRTAAVIAVTVAFGVGLYFLWSIRTIILWVVVAAVLAFALEPAVRWLMSKGMGRGPASILVSAAAVLAAVGVLALVIAPLALQWRELTQDVPATLRELTKEGSPLRFLQTRYDIIDRVRNPRPEDFRMLFGSGRSVTAAISTTLQLVAAAVSVVVIMVLLLVEGPRSWRGFLSLLREEQRERAARLGDRMQRAVGGYVRGNLLISLIAGPTAWLAMVILDVPFPLPLAVMVAILDVIPLVGATVAALICTAIALSQGWTTALILLAFFLVYQQVENNVLQPVIYSKTVALSPLTVLVASLAGAAFAGVIGVLIAIPLTAAGYILVQDLVERRQEEVVEADAEAEGELPGRLEGGAGRMPSPTGAEVGEERGGVETVTEAARESEEAEIVPAEAERRADHAEDHDDPGRQMHEPPDDLDQIGRNDARGQDPPSSRMV